MSEDGHAVSTRAHIDCDFVMMLDSQVLQLLTKQHNKQKHVSTEKYNKQTKIKARQENKTLSIPQTETESKKTMVLLHRPVHY